MAEEEKKKQVTYREINENCTAEIPPPPSNYPAKPVKKRRGAQPGKSPSKPKATVKALSRLFDEYEVEDDAALVEVFAKFSDVEMRFVESMARHGNLSQASKDAGVSLGTSVYWSRRPEIKRAFVGLRRQVAASAFPSVRFAAGLGARYLSEVMLDPDAPRGDKLKAAKTALEYAGKMEDRIKQSAIDDLEERLAAVMDAVVVGE